jgi:hypothetical protein
MAGKPLSGTYPSASDRGRAEGGAHLNSTKVLWRAGRYDQRMLDSRYCSILALHGR